MPKIYIFSLVALAGIIFGFAWAEQITMTTYYPAPYGEYQTLRVRCTTIGARTLVAAPWSGRAQWDVATNSNHSANCISHSLGVEGTDNFRLLITETDDAGSIGLRHNELAPGVNYSWEMVLSRLHGNRRTRI